ncbi:hypothetical protein IJ732_02890 [bacterium]|nr:hypothetical protein [bacterium]
MIAETLLLAQINYNLIAEYNMESLTPNLRNLENAYPSGLEYKDESHVKMGPPSTTDPVLFIVDPIFDKDYHYIPPGYYQLTLDPSREYMYLVQSGKTLAVIPVFKIEIDAKGEEKKRKEQMPQTFWKQKKFLVKRYFKERRRKQNIKKKRIEPEEKVHSEATIELVSAKRYFLIKYEKDTVRAWGALRYR